MQSPTRLSALVQVRVLVVAVVGAGALLELATVWALADVALGFMALVNLVALVLLAAGPWAPSGTSSGRRGQARTWCSAAPATRTCPVICPTACGPPSTPPAPTAPGDPQRRRRRRLRMRPRTAPPSRGSVSIRPGPIPRSACSPATFVGAPLPRSPEAGCAGRPRVDESGQATPAPATAETTSQPRRPLFKGTYGSASVRKRARKR